MTEPTTRDRSPSFPFIPLAEAIDRLKELEAKFGRHPAPASKVGLAWGVKDGGSQGAQIVAALKAFGLVDYEGTAADRKALISDFGRNYLRAQQESVKAKVLQEVALKPTQLAKFWGLWGRKRPPDPVCEDVLVLESDFTQSAAKKFLKVYDQTLEFANLHDHEGPPEEEKENGVLVDATTSTEALEVGSSVNVETSGVLQNSSPVRVRAIQSHGGKAWFFVEGNDVGLSRDQLVLVDRKIDSKFDDKPPRLPFDDEFTGSKAQYREEKISLDEGDVSLRWPSRLGSESVEDLKDWLDGIIRRAARRANAPE